MRKAASLAIDRKTLADIHMPGCDPIGTIGLKEDPIFGASFPRIPYDPEKAKKLLAEAGYPKGFQGGKFYPYEGGYWPYGEQVATYWKAVGIHVDTVLLDRPAWFANREGGKMKGGIFIDNPTSLSADYEMYAGQAHRPITVGVPPTPVYQKMFEVAVEAYTRILKALKPGATHVEIKKAASVIQDEGFTTFDATLHGWGLDRASSPGHRCSSDSPAP